MSERQAYTDQAQRRLAEAERQMLQMSGSSQIEATDLAEQLQQVHRLEQKVRNRLTALQESTERSWDELQRDLEEALRELDAALAHARSLMLVGGLQQPSRKAG